MQEIADADGRDHNAHPGRGPQGFVSRPFNDKAQNDRQGHGQEQSGGNHQPRREQSAQEARQVDHHQAGCHKNVTVGKVNQTQDAVNHGVPDGNQGILTAQRDAGKQDRERILHENHPSLELEIRNEELGMKNYGTGLNS